MTQEEKELLKRDLCARLPYGVIIQHPDLFRPSVLVTEKLEEYYKGHFGSDGFDAEFVKPYLRPMESMTEEEFQELHSICPHSSFNKTNVPGWIIGISGSDYGRISRIDEISKLIDWLNKKMFDYHKDDEGKTMTEKGLALKAPEGMYS